MEVMKNETYLMLYVEDDPTTRSLLNTAISFKFPNLRVMTAENGKVGLELYQEHRPDMVLTDISMPVMDGIAMAAEIKELDPAAVITVLSAYCDTQEYLATMQEIGILHCVGKPVDYRELFATLEQCIREVRETPCPGLPCAAKHL